MDGIDIYELLPHRPPLLLVDKVLGFEPGKSIHAIKLVSHDEPVLMGHFPGNPVWPGVYVIEGLAQTSAILAFQTMKAKGEPFEKNCLLSTVEEARFKKQISPGDILHYHTEFLRARGNFAWFSGEAKVEGVTVATAKFSAFVSARLG